MRKDVGVDGDAQRISQIVWLLFLKIFDDKEQEWAFTNPGYKSPLPDRFRWTNWAKQDEGITGDALIDFVNNHLFPVLKNLATTWVSPHGKVVGAVFEDAYNYMKSGTLLRQVINSIEKDVDFNSSTDRHLFNDIYEKILADLQSAGNAGEYYTPRAVTQFMVDIIDPKLGEKLLDPACGTGGFLTNTIEHLKPFLKTTEDRVTLQETLNGVEKKPLPHMLAMTNVMLHGIDVPSNILHDNTLSRPLRDYGTKDRVDIIITNPPFGGDGGRWDRKQFSQEVPNPRNCRFVYGVDYAPAQAGYGTRCGGVARWVPIWRGDENQSQTRVAGRFQSAYDRPIAQGRFQPLHEH